MEHAEIAVQHERERLADITYNDPYAYFLLQGSIELNAGVLSEKFDNFTDNSIKYFNVC